MRPRPQRQRDLLPHEAPGQVRVEGCVHQELGAREEEAGGDVRDLGRTFLGPPAVVPRVDPQDPVLHVAGGELARAQARPPRTALVGRIAFRKPWGVGAQDRLGVGAGGLGLRDVAGVPPRREAQVRVRLEEVRLAPPQLAREVPGRRGAVALRLVDCGGRGRGRPRGVRSDLRSGRGTFAATTRFSPYRARTCPRSQYWT